MAPPPAARSLPRTTPPRDPDDTALLPTPFAALLPFDQQIVAGTVSPARMATYAQRFRSSCTVAATADQARDPATLARWRTALVQQEEPVLTADTINRTLAARRAMLAAAEQGELPGDVADAVRRVRGVQGNARTEDASAPLAAYHRRSDAGAV